MRSRQAVCMEFHVSRRARDLYDFDQLLFSLTGNVLLVDFHAARLFAQKMNQKRDLARFPDRAVKAGQLHAMGLIDEILHRVVAWYREQRNPLVMQQALSWLDERFTEPVVQGTLRRFAEEFPPLAVYRNELTLTDYMQGQTAGVPHRQVLLEEMLLLWLANANPAFSPFRELFDDTVLSRQTAYPSIISALSTFFVSQPAAGARGQSLFDMLREPALAAPDSLVGQLAFIRDKWSAILGSLVLRILGGLDLVREEDKATFGGPGPALPLEFPATLVLEAERYSTDRDWMPKVVLLAKSSYVWLDQLSWQYGYPITRLDQVPDQELDLLAQWGFTALWLIGVWQRSQASRQIKQIMGNPEAVASAYSLHDYVIADDLGGEEAFRDLKERAAQRGIRMAGDMVPNHVGIDAKWVIEHPDWFVSLDNSPFPSHTFSGPDLSWDQRVGIFLEDHYYDHSDASVVFKRLDRWTGATRYIYHGNDGTSMPWNDTAQLNYLNSTVREAVIQTILHVARKFPLIRFDAAMTLAKRHYQRLWYPEPGAGGAIPTRAEHGMSREDFDAAMPEEFWREVVDRVALEAPDTLLLAEAFWLMEGYFVRSLGMHRVYNSAFMNMLKAEDNAKYRTTIKNVLEFDPEILKRFVNFMSNPDEETAVAQFGKHDKYFGVCVMMATLPGTPMFGHGQVQGFSEKYGMEYRRAYWDEKPDEELVRRHEREIFPLLHKRYLFAEVESFRLYDFVGPDGHVNEDVFAYSNRWGDERALVVYHNKYAEARGRIRMSTTYSARDKGTDERRPQSQALGESLAISRGEGLFCVFREHIAGLEYIRSCDEIHDQGLAVELGAFKYQVFMDFREIQDTPEHHYGQLAALLGGRGVPSIADALVEMQLQPLHDAFDEVFNPALIEWAMGTRAAGGEYSSTEEFLTEVEETALKMLNEALHLVSTGAGTFLQSEKALQQIAHDMRMELARIVQPPVRSGRSPHDRSSRSRSMSRPVESNGEMDAESWGMLLGWWAVHSLGKLAGDAGFSGRSRAWIDEWLLGRRIVDVLERQGLSEPEAQHALSWIKALASHQLWCQFSVADTDMRAAVTLAALLQDDDLLRLLQVHRYQDTVWYNKEAYSQMLWGLQWVSELGAAVRPERQARQESKAARDVLKRLVWADKRSGYKVNELVRLFGTPESLSSDEKVD